MEMLELKEQEEEDRIRGGKGSEAASTLLGLLWKNSWPLFGGLVVRLKAAMSFFH